jgi:hypothetical protein
MLLFDSFSVNISQFSRFLIYSAGFLKSTHSIGWIAGSSSLAFAQVINFFIFVLIKPIPMKRLFTLFSILSIYSYSQTTIPNAGFESWGGNPSPGVSGEPTFWYSNKSGSNIAKLANPICFQDGTIKHSGNYSVRVETINYFGSAVNGAVTSGVINAPTTSKSDGYIGTVNYSSSSDVRYMNFTGRPDSITGWYQYTSGGAGEQPKLRAILHTLDYFDPETPTTNHPACISNKIGDALWIGPTGSQSTWKRFSVPFTYTSSATPTHIMINITSSANQLTTVVGSKLWIDDLAMVYNSTKVNEVNKEAVVKVYTHDKIVYVDLQNSDEAAVLTIFDLTGKAVGSYKVDSNKQNSFDLSTYNNGLYLYQVSASDYKRSGKFIIE